MTSTERMFLPFLIEKKKRSSAEVPQQRLITQLRHETFQGLKYVVFGGFIVQLYGLNQKNVMNIQWCAEFNSREGH